MRWQGIVVEGTLIVVVVVVAGEAVGLQLMVALIVFAGAEEVMTAQW